MHVYCCIIVLNAVLEDKSQKEDIYSTSCRGQKRVERQNERKDRCYVGKEKGRIRMIEECKEG